MKIHLFQRVMHVLSGLTMVLSTFMPPIANQLGTRNLQQVSNQPNQPQAITFAVQPALTQATVGEPVEITIQASSLDAALSGFQFDLTYDPLILQLQSVAGGAQLGSSGRQVVCPPAVQPTGSSLRFACASSGAAAGADQTGVLAVLTFLPLAEGNSALTLSGLKAAGAGTPAVTIGAGATNGSVSVSAAGTSLFLPVMNRAAVGRIPGGTTAPAATNRAPAKSQANALSAPSQSLGVVPAGFMTVPSWRSPRLTPAAAETNGCFATDLDCDQDVDSGDLGVAAAFWNCSTGQACYATLADLDANGLVDVFDLAWVGNDYDVTPPQITVSAPQPNQVLTSSPVTVTGTASDRHALTSVAVNGVVASINGSSFSASVPLDPGNQVLTVSAQDALGQVNLVEQVVTLDSEGPLVTILQPMDRQSVYTLQPAVEVELQDFSSAMNLGSFQAQLTDDDGVITDISADLTVSASGASGTLSNPLVGDTTYTLTVQIADTGGNIGSASSTFYVPVDAGGILPPDTPDAPGWVSGVVYDSATCDQHQTTCTGLTGARVTLSLVDTVALAQVRLERATQTRINGPQPPMSKDVYTQFTTALTGTVITGPDGFFAFPVDDTGVYWLRIEKDGYTYGQREAEIVKDRSTATNSIYLTPLDPAVTECDTDGCVHTSSDGVMQLVVPEGAIPSGSVDINSTYFDQVEFLPSGSLPEGTWETYAFNLGGDSEYVFDEPVTVRVANDKDFEPGTPVPLGYWNQVTQLWEHAGTGVVDASGDWIEMQVMHFSNYDCNDPIADPDDPNPDPDDENDDDDDDECEEGDDGCFVSLRSGTMSEQIALPGLEILGQDRTATLIYNTSRAYPTEVIDIKMSLNPGPGVTLGDWIGFELYIEGFKTDAFTFDANLTAGEIGRYRYLWDGRDSQGQLLPPGVYDYRAKFSIPYTAQYCYALGGIFGNPPDCQYGATGRFLEAFFTVWARGTVELNTQVDSPLGNGWVLDGLQRLYEDEAGRILVVDGDNIAEFYIAGKDLLSQQTNASTQPPVLEQLPPPQPEELPDERPLEPQIDPDVIIPPFEGLVAPDENQVEPAPQAPTEQPAEPPLPISIEPSQPEPLQPPAPAEPTPQPPEERQPVFEPYRETRNGIQTDVGGTIGVNTTWTLANSPYVVVSDITVSDGVTLTIEPGVDVIMNLGRTLNVNGNLVAAGTAGQPIDFLPSSPGASGHWYYVRVGGGTILTDSDASQISYVNIEGGGRSTTYALHVNRALFPIDHVNVRDSAGDGIHIYNYQHTPGLTLDSILIEDSADNGIEAQYAHNLTITNLTIQNSAGYGIYNYASDTAFTLTNATVNASGDHGLYLYSFDGVATLDTVTFSNSAGYGINTFSGAHTLNLLNTTISNNAVTARVHPNTQFTSVTLSGNTRNEIEYIAGTQTSSLAWNQPVSAYRLVGNVTVSDGVTLTIPAGTTIYMEQSTTLYSNGNLVAVGNLAQPINFLASTPGVPGHWYYLRVGGGTVVGDSNASQLSYVNFAGGGRSSTYSLYIYQAAFPIDHINVSDSGGDGINIYNYQVTLPLSLDTVAIEDSTLDGMEIQYGETVTVTNLTIQNSGGRGLYNYANDEAFTLINAAITNSTDHSLDLYAVDGNVTLDTVTLDGSAAYGIFTQSGVHTLNLLNTTISNNAVTARVHPNTQFTSVSLSGNTRNEIEYIVGTQISNLAWDQPVSAYRLIGDVTVSDGVTLTIPAGTTVYMELGRTMYANGNLIAVGTAGQPINFLPSVPGALGHWYYLRIGAGTVVGDSDASQLSYVNFSGGGRGSTYSLYLYQASITSDHLNISDSAGEGIYIYNYNVDTGITLDTISIQDTAEEGLHLYYADNSTLTNVDIQNSGTDGLLIEYTDGTLTMDNVNIDASAEYGIFTTGGTHTLLLQNSTISNNAVPARLHPGAQFTNVTWSGNSRNELEYINGTQTGDRTWNQPVEAYRLVGNVTVADGGSLTIPAGTTVLMEQYRDLTVNGNLFADGTPSQPITFTSAITDTTGYWGYVRVGAGTITTDSDASVLRNLVIEGGGYSLQPSLYIHYALPVIENIVIRGSGGEGIYVYNYQRPGMTMSNISVDGAGQQGLNLTYVDNLALTNVVITGTLDSGIYLNSSDDVTLENVAIDAAGNYGLEIYVPGGFMDVTDLTISGAASHGIFSNGGTLDLDLQNVTLTGNHIAARLHPNMTHTNLVISGNDYDIIEWIGGTITQPVTWGDETSDYRMLASITVQDGITLTIQSGVQVEVDRYDDLNVYGTLLAAGTPTQPITFTALNPDPNYYWGTLRVGGSTNLGDSSNSVLSYLRLIKGGYSMAALYLYYADVDVSNVIIERSRSRGIYAYYSDGWTLSDTSVSESRSSGIELYNNQVVTLTNFTSAENGGAGVLVYYGNDLIIQDSSLTGNLTYGISMEYGGTDGEIHDTLISGNTFAGRLPVNTLLDNVTWLNNTFNELTFNGGTITGDRIWEYIPGALETYRLTGDVTIADGATLTITQGVDIIVTGTGTNLLVNGNLHAVGTLEEPIRIMASTEGAIGAWDYIRLGGGNVLTDSNDTQLSYVTIEGGGRTLGLLYVFYSTPSLDHLTLRNSQNAGIYSATSAPYGVSISNFYNLAADDYGINNITPAQVISATYNYWGDVSGPYHPTLNPTASGARVSDGVVFDPWLYEEVSDLGVISLSRADHTTLEYDGLTGAYIRHYEDGRRVYFDTAGLHDFTVDPSGSRTDYTYNPDGTLAAIGVIPAGQSTPRWTWSFAYSGGRLVSITDPAARITQVSIDANNHLRSFTFPDGTTRQFAYDSRSLMTQQIDQGGGITDYTYDPYGRIRQVVEPARLVYDYNTAASSILRETKLYTPSDTAYPLINSSAVGTPDTPAPAMPLSDELVDGVQYGVGGRSGITNAWGFWLEQTDAEGRTTYYERDLFNNLVEKTLPNGDCIRYTYDLLGNQLSETHLPASQCGLTNPVQQHTWTFTYESRFNQVKTETDPNGSTTTYFYDYELGLGEAGNLVRIQYPPVQDETGATVVPVQQYTYNTWGQMTASIDPRGVETRFVYTQGTPDEASGGANPLFAPGVSPVPGLLTRVIEDFGGANRTSILRSFNALGLPGIVIAPNTAQTLYTYDAHGRMLTETDALGRVTKYEYDARGYPSRLVRDYTPDGVTGRNVVTTYVYNAYGQLELERSEDGGVVLQTVNVYDINRNLALSSDGEGSTTRYLYDDANQRVAMIDAENNQTSYTYTPAGQRATMTLPDGTLTEFTYDGYRRLVNETIDPGGLAITVAYSYDANGNLTLQTNPDGTQTCFAYDAVNRLVETVEDCADLERTTTYRYDLSGNQALMIDPNGVITERSYDDLGRQVEVIQDAGGLGITNSYTYDPLDNPLTYTNPNGVETAYQYNLLGLPVQTTLDVGGENIVTTYTYDRLNYRRTQTDALDRTQTLIYNGLGQILSQSDALGNTMIFTYDNAGNRLSEIDPSGRAVQYAYDGLNRLVTRTNALGDQQTFTYDARGNLASETDENNHTTSYTYDAAGRNLTATNPENETRTYTYDDAGRMLTLLDAEGGLRTYEYDGLGRLVEATDPVGNRSEYVYDLYGNLLSETHAIPPAGTTADGQTTTYDYDALNRRTSQTNPLNHTVDFGYDDYGNRTSLTDANNRTTQFAYDALNRLATVTDPLNRQTVYFYDDAGQVTELAYGDGKSIEYGYDLAGRPVSVNYSTGGQITRTFDAAGRILTVQGLNTDISLAYDALGRVQSYTDHNLSKTVTYQYDPAGNRTALTAPDGLGAVYSYDAADRLVTLVSGSQTYAFEYDDAGRLTHLTFPNNASQSFSYDLAGRAQQVEDRNPGGTVVNRLTYTFDAAGNRKTVTYLNNDVVTYTYDDANQLTGEQRTGSLAYNQSFTYDPAGNRLTWTNNAVLTSYTYDTANQLLSQTGAVPATYTYDGRGNRATRTSGGQTTTYTYDAEGRLTGASSSGQAVTYAYDAFDRRVSQTINTSTTRFLYDTLVTGATVLGEYNASGGLTTGYILAPSTDGRVARTQGGQSYYYLRDSLGSTRAMMNQAGALVNTYDYDGYGNLRASTTGVDDPYRFAGGRWDSALSLYNNRARFFDPASGRFTQPDPLGFVDGENLYVYGQNNPCNRIDPLGWSSKSCDTVAFNTDNLTGLLGIANKLTSALRFLPNAPEVEWTGKVKVEGKLCEICCEQGEGECPSCARKDKKGSIQIQAEASMEVKWPFAALDVSVGIATLKIGLEAYIKLGGTVGGGGEIDFCTGQTSVNVCGEIGISGGVRGGLLEAEAGGNSVKAFLYGEIGGKCKLCLQYTFGAGVNLGETGCTFCAKVGVKVEIPFFFGGTLEYEHTFYESGGC